MLDETTTAIAIYALVTKSDDIWERPESFVIVDSRGVDKLNAHRPGDITLQFQESHSRRPTDRVIEDQNTGGALPQKWR